MGLWQNLCEAYSANEELLRKTYPLSTTTVNNANKPLLVVKINDAGELQSIGQIPKRAKNEPLQSFVVPVTEASMGRTGTEPHPLFDNYAYIKGAGEKYERYLKELEKRKDLSREFAAVYNYVKRGTLAEDAKQFEPKDDVFVLFEVEYPGETNARLWENESLMVKWHQYYMGLLNEKARNEEVLAKDLREQEDKLAQLESEKSSCTEKTRKKELQEEIKEQKQQVRVLRNAVREVAEDSVFCVDMITGDRMESAISHPKKIVNAAGNAKLISDNDKENFTYRGKFANAQEAYSVGYESSQRAHQFLRFVVNEYGIKCDSQVIVAFTTAKKGESRLSLPQPPVSDVLWDDLDAAEEPLSANNNVILFSQTGGDFAQALAKALNGYKEDAILKPRLHDPTMIVILDAATTGRLSVTFYREMSREDYLEKLCEWHRTCRWHFTAFHKGKQDSEAQRIEYEGAPTIDDIIGVVFGRPHGSDSGYNKIKKVARETLMRCVFDNSPFPENYLRLAVQRASAPFANAVNEKGKFNRSAFSRNLSVACALVNKSLIDKGKEPYGMCIETTHSNRDYLYGRLLGAADKLEEYALYKGGNSREETAAIRYMQTFSQKPYSTWNTIHQTLVPYIQHVKNSLAFRELQEIHAKFKEENINFEDDTPLSGIYLLGYYCERAQIEQMAKELKESKEQ